MSQIPSLQCLFCQHLNLPDADYCQRCDGQLNLQPCNQCGAVDDRTAKNCHKCGAAFSPPVVPEVDSPFAPTFVGKEPAYPASENPGLAHPKAQFPRGGLIYVHPERQTVSEVLPPEPPATKAPLRSGSTGAILAITFLLSITAAGFYFYRGHGARSAPTQGQGQVVTDPSGAGRSKESAPSNGQTEKDTASRSPSAAPVPQATTDRPAQAPSPTPLGNDAALAAGPSPATDTETRTLEDPSTVERCPPAVATLGLCNPDTQQEKP